MAVPIIQVTYEVPAEVAVGLASGEMSRFGSVVRGSTNIVSHLKEIQTLPESTTKKNALTGVRKPAIYFAAATAATVVGSGCYAFYTLHRRVQELGGALNTYFEAVHQGSLDSTVVEQVLNGIANLPRFAVRSDQLAPAAQHVGRITEELAKANATPEQSWKFPAAEADNVSSLRHNLKAQLRILSDAA